MSYPFERVAGSPQAIDLRLADGDFESLGFVRVPAPQPGDLVVFRFAGSDVAFDVDPYTGATSAGSVVPDHALADARS